MSAVARFQSLLIDPPKNGFRRSGRYWQLLLMDHEPRIVRRKFVTPCRTLTLGFLRHIAEPQYRLIFVEVIYCGTPQSNELLEVAGEA
jgi:hypothetical protein